MACSLSQWIDVLSRRQHPPSAAAGKVEDVAAGSDLSRYAHAGVLGDPRVRERFIADVMAPAARAILSADGVVYQIALTEKAAPKHQTCRIVRVVVGFFQSAARGSMHRVTAYHVDPWDRTFVFTGQDGLFGEARCRIASWDGRSPAATRSLKKRLDAVFDEVSGWAASNLPTSAEARSLAQLHASQVEELKRLYEFFYDSGDAQARSSEGSQTGYFAASAGYLQKLEEHVRRMIPVYRPCLLSAGEIRASLPTKLKKNDALERFSL